MSKNMTEKEWDEYREKIISGEIKPKTLGERWQEEGIEAFNFTPPSEAWKKRMDYFNSEEGLKLWDEAMEEEKDEHKQGKH